MINFDTIDLTISTSYSLLILFIVLGIIYTFYIYRFTIPAITKFAKSLLITLRISTIVLIIILIFEPTLILKYDSTIEPINLVFVDDSESIVNRDSLKRTESITNFLKNFDKQSEGENLYYSFSTSIDTIPDISKMNLKFDQTRTNFEQIIEFIENSKQNIASATIISDGIVNDGSNSSSDFKKLDIPVYTIEVGDTTIVTDVSIKKVLYNDLIYSNTPTELRVVLLNQFLGGKNGTVFLYENSKLINQVNIKFDQSGINNVSFTYTPQNPGENSMIVEVSRLNNEQTFSNNHYPFVLNVLKDKIKVLLVSGSPSPDHSFIKQMLKKNDKIDTDVIVQITDLKFLPDNNFKSKIDSTDVIFMNDFPSKSSPIELISNITDAINNKKKSFFYILSESVDQQKLNSMALDLPVKIQNQSNKIREISPIITQSATPIISTTSMEISKWNNLPPIFQLESNISLLSGSNVLALAKLKNTETEIPLITSRNIGSNRSILINGFGIWKWELQSDENLENLIESFLNNSIKWLYVENQKQRFFVSPTKKIFSQGEDIDFRASIYDETLTARNDATIEILTKNTNESYLLQMNNLGNGIYEGKFNIADPGDYSFKSNINLDNSSFSGPSGRFIVSSINIENINYVLNKNYLKLISNITSGKSFEVDKFNGLFNDLNFNQKTRVIKESIISRYDVWANEWMLVLIVILFSIEWFLRKQKGLI